MLDKYPFEKPISVLIVIVNYRTANLTINCLHSLANEVQANSIGIIVVDNASGDDSVSKISYAIQTQGWGNWVFLLTSEHNGGYAYGNNLAIRSALSWFSPPTYFLLLNPDTQVYPGAVKALVDFLEQHPQVGIAGSSFENADGTNWPYAFRFPTILSEFDTGLRLGVVTKLLSKWVLVRTMTNEEDEVDWLPGASIMIRREVFEKVGLMDENYFLYYEETDFCLQAKRAGWSCWYVPQSRVMHIAGQSTGITQRNVRPPRLPQYWFDSRQRFFLKNYGWLYTSFADTVWILGFSLWQIRRIIQRKPNEDSPYFLGDFLRNSIFLKRNPITSSH